MSLGSALDAGRRAAESRMTSTCTITHESPAGTRDAAGFRTGSTSVYAGPCRVAGVSGGLNASRRENVGGTEFQIATRTLHLPAGTSGLSDGDLAAITGGECEGLVLRLLEVTPQDQATALRISCVEV